MTRQPRQPELPGLAGSDSSEQLDITCHELAELQSRLATEGRCIVTLEVLRHGYRATIQKRHHNATAPPALP